MDPTLMWQIKVTAFQLLIFNVVGWGWYYFRQSRMEAARTRKPPAVIAPGNRFLRGVSNSQN